MPSYNITQLQAADTVNELFVYANDVTGQVLMGLFMIAIFFIMLMVLKRWDFDKALLSSSFSCFILATILSYGRLLNFMIPLLFLIIMAFTGFYMYMNR